MIYIAFFLGGALSVCLLSAVLLWLIERADSGLSRSVEPRVIREARQAAGKR